MEEETLHLDRALNMLSCNRAWDFQVLEQQLEHEEESWDQEIETLRRRKQALLDKIQQEKDKNKLLSTIITALEAQLSDLQTKLVH